MQASSILLYSDRRRVKNFKLSSIAWALAGLAVTAVAADRYKIFRESFTAISQRAPKVFQEKIANHVRSEGYCPTGFVASDQYETHGLFGMHIQNNTFSMNVSWVRQAGDRALYRIETNFGNYSRLIETPCPQTKSLPIATERNPTISSLDLASLSPR